ncbi:Hypp7687 [Branchiostoma lanceolatum]|uniref:Hypp7687 protein n=1 Tax=Branchiostoma lanceolatum TaxID=7740 RepID=A0A8J9Z2A1_BRALA|nr:Hypp7687 [Branchiostoma lanceolatum]
MLWSVSKLLKNLLFLSSTGADVKTATFVKMSAVGELQWLVCFLGLVCVSASLTTVTWEGHSSDKRPVVIIDDILSRDIIKGIRGYMLRLDWKFSIADDFYTFDSNNFLNNSDHGNYTNAPWQSTLPTAAFRRSKSWRAMNAFLTEKRGKEFRPTDVKGYILSRGDFPLYQNTCVDEDDYRVVVFLNDVWRKDWYGHLTIHDELGRMHAAHPRKGRVVFMPCDLSFVMKPPAMQTAPALYALVVMATPRQTTEESDLPDSDPWIGFGSLSKAEIEEMKERYNYFPQPDSALRQIDVEKHVTRRFSLPDGRTITVLDDVFTPDEILALTDYLAANCTYTDANPEEDSDNVRWITGFDIDVFAKSFFWRASREIVSHVSGNSGFYPYDVALNLIRLADHTMIHEDCENARDEFTLLIYLNPDWEVRGTPLL